MPNDFTVHSYGTDSSGRPILMTAYMHDWWLAVVDRLGFEPVITQGAFQARNGGGAGSSAGTHDEAGCIDLRVWNLTEAQVGHVVRELRRSGAAAWLRNMSHGGFGDSHVHFVLGADSPLHPAAKAQWSEYLAGGDGLRGDGRDYHWRPDPMVTKPPPPPVVERHERIGTMNEKTTVDVGQAASDLAAVAEHCDILGLQEWGPNRQRILNSHHGWTWTKPGAACPPVGARTHRYTLLSAHKHLLARGRRVEPVPGRKTMLPDCNATVAFWTERKTGDSVAVINWHLPAHIEARGIYRRLRDHLTGRARMHRTARRNGRRYADRLIRQGIDRVYIVGDTNYHLMRLRGWISCWDGHHPKATHGSRTIDIIYARQRSDAARTFNTASDHHAVIATYTLEG